MKLVKKETISEEPGPIVPDFLTEHGGLIQQKSDYFDYVVRKGASENTDFFIVSKKL